MATDVASDDTVPEDANSKSLELFTLIWLDDNDHAKEGRETQQKLRAIINQLIRCRDIEQCKKLIVEQSNDNRIVMIVNGRLGEKTVPSIHMYRQVSSIYVYCKDKEKNQVWTSKYPKVRAVIIDLAELVSRIEADYKIQKAVEEPLSINMFAPSSATGKATTGINGQFVYSQVLIDCLIRMRSSQADKNELIACCTKQYQDNTSELDHIREFQHSYTPEKALWWYTRESFFYKTLNAALRTQNIHTIFLFRSYITDIWRQLRQRRAEHPLRVYRSQLMTSDELEILKQLPGQYISVNSFFSTSLNRKTALSFLSGSTSTELKRVLFEIDADSQMVTTRPFADVSSFSDFPNESEVLFMFGSIFRLNNVTTRDDNVYVISMHLCSDDENVWKQVFLHIKSQTGTGETNLRILGKILGRMGQFGLAEKYYRRFIDEFPPNHPFLATVYEDLAEVTAQNGDLEKSLEWQQKAIDIQRQNPAAGFIRPQKGTKVIIPHIPANAKWLQRGVTVAGGHGCGSGMNQLNNPVGIFVDENRTVTIADCANDRIIEWRYGATSGRIMAGGNEPGNRADQLKGPADMVIDEDNLIVCDTENRRIVRYSLHSNTGGETILSNIGCRRLAMDNDGFFYVSDTEKHEVKRYRIGETTSTIVAGGHGLGNQFDQLNWPTYLFVDQEGAVYVSDNANHRIMKWPQNAKEGILVAGGRGFGNHLSQLPHPDGIAVDSFGTVYVIDNGNHRVIRWYKGVPQGSIIVGGNGPGDEPNQLKNPQSLAFDTEGNLYVADWGNHRVQRFDIESK